MARYILFTFFLFSTMLQSLEIAISKGMQENHKYSVINLSDKNNFLCETKLNQLGVAKTVICSFDKIPTDPLKTVITDFFTVEPKIVDGNFFLIIKAKYQLYLQPIIFDLVKDNEVFLPQTKIAKRWVVVGYEKKIPFLQQQRSREKPSISFPYFLSFETLPFVGGLDLKGNPVHIQNSEDVKGYVDVKKLFDKGKYEDCIELIDTTLAKYPKTLFRSELLYYKIKSFAKLRMYDSVIDLSKEYLRLYSSSENVPEVLLITAYAYYKNGQYSDADYFFDRLFTEHQESVFAKKGFIYKGDMALDSAQEKVAKKFYEKAYHNTKNIEVATLAAFRLAQLYIAQGKYQKAIDYINKILQANKTFFYKHYSASKKMMYDLVDAQKYLPAARIDEALLAYMKKAEDDYEVNVKNAGIWLAKTTHKREAIQFLEQYIHEFPDGDYIEDVEKTRDSLFFDITNADDATLLAKYDKLIQTYKDGPIAQRALYEKAKLMLKKRMFSDILEIKKELLALQEDYPDVEEIIQKAVLGLMENALANKQCGLVLRIQEENNVSIDPKWDDGLYDCFMKAGDFQKAKQIAKRDMISADIEQKKKWLYRYAKVSFATGNYSEVIDAAHDLLSMIDSIKTSPYKDIYRVLFDAYDRLGNFDKMVETIEKIQELFGLNYKDIDRFIDMINVGVAKKDDNIIIKYGKKLFALQKRLHSYGESPFLEFALYSAYMNKEEYKKALEVISYIDNLKLKPEQKARQRYLKGVVLDKLWENKKAKQAYKEAIEADKDSAWAKLAQSALELD